MLNINNQMPREVICKRVENGNYFPNGNLLQIGKKYHLVKMDVYSWHTEVWLKEFPGKIFNSVQFAEIFPQEANVRKLVQANRRERKLIATFSESSVPQIVLSKTMLLDLSPYKDEIKLMKPGEAFTIGRENCTVLLPQENIYSRLHCYICKTSTGKYGLVDCSLNGTLVSL